METTVNMVCPSWLSFLLYNPVRKYFTDRKRILAESGVTASSVVVEVGAGNGFLTEALAEHALKVYAVELQEGMVRKLKRRVDRFTEKVSIIKGDIALVSLDQGSADVCILYYSFHEFRDKRRAVDVIVGAIKKGGIISIYEPTMEVGKKSMLEAAVLFEERGFKKVRDRDDFFTRFVSLQKL